MKKLKNTLILSSVLLFIGNNSFAASGTTEVTNYTKFIAFAVAALIIILLLFLGYKMDSKENSTYNVKKTKKKEKAPIVDDVKYEPDTVSYEKDNVDVDNYLEKTEYDEDEELEEDEEKSLFDSINNDDSNYINEEPEEYGEEFDTSVIDNIDDEDDIVIPEKNMDETVVFDKPPVTEDVEALNIENEIDDLDNLDDIEPEEKVEDIDPLMKELDNINKAETTFEGFSVEPKNDKKTDETNKTKPRKKYTKSKKVDSSAEADFLSQMEETMKKDKEARDSKKTTKKKK